MVLLCQILLYNPHDNWKYKQILKHKTKHARENKCNLQLVETIPKLHRYIRFEIWGRLYKVQGRANHDLLTGRQKVEWMPIKLLPAPPLHPRWLLANPGLLADTVGVCPAAVTLSEERGQGQWEILWPAGSERSFSAKPSGWSGAVSSVHQSCSVLDPRETWPSESKGLTTDMIISSPFVLRNFSVPVVTGAPSRWWWKIYTEHPRQAM